MASIESIFSFREFLKKIGSENYDFREKKIYINPENKENYLFNTTIKKIEESDLILLIGTNPRHEATIVNARLRKSFVQNKTPVYSIGNPGDITYEYKMLGEDTEELKKIFEGTSEINTVLKKCKRPLFIIGESALELKNSQFIVEETFNFLKKNNFVNDDWNGFNILSQNASSIGALDLRFFNINEENNFIFFDKLMNNEFKILYLLGSDNLMVNKKNEFIIYQGSHGDKGATIADVILPSPAYTEQNGLYANMEGRIQECRKASYPAGEALEDWKIFNLINYKINNSNLFNNHLELREASIKEIPNFSKIDSLPTNNSANQKKSITYTTNEKIFIKSIDYYFTNSIARASKTMSDCRNIKFDKKNRTNN